MANEDDSRLVFFDHDESLEQPDAETPWYREALSSRPVKFGIAGVAAAAIAFAVVSLAHPFGLFGNATASLTGASAPQGDSHETASGAGTSLPAASEALTDRETAAPSQAAEQGQGETGQAPTAALLGRFQAWAARDAAPDVQPAQQAETNSAQPTPVQAAPAPADPVEDARAEIPPVPRSRPAPRVKPAADMKATAELQAKPKPPAKLHREQSGAQVQPAPAGDKDMYLQNTRPPSFLESLGIRN